MEQTNKEKITRILLDELEHRNCDNCRHPGEYSEECEECSHKSNWNLHPYDAEKIAEKILDALTINEEKYESVMELIEDAKQNYGQWVIKQDQETLKASIASAVKVHEAIQCICVDQK